jgi:formylglycine-generating enzyme required for sulfatase activity
LDQLGFRPNDELDDWKKKWVQWQKSDIGEEIIAAGGNTTPVGSFPKGESFYGCYDMAGNVYEWCQDWFMGDYYKLKDAKRNPEGPTEEQAEEVDFSGKGDKIKARVLRGGSWCSPFSGGCRPVVRHRAHSSRRFYNHGFRVVVRLAQ